MFKRLAERFLPSNHNQLISKIRIEYGELLSQSEYDAILFFMLPKLDWGGGLNAAILEKAGDELDTYLLENVQKPHNGDVYALPAYNLAILDHWDGGTGFEERDLRNCYRRTIEKAQNMGIKRIAIPALGRDKRDFPHIRFARVALKGVLEKMDDRIEQVTIMCVDRRMYNTYHTQLEKISRKD
jgi:O-acetyl-ADP-ribose deacetylase (regulator of RNase III)